MKETVYISGPITGTEDYIERFDDAEKRFLDGGYIVLNPVRINKHMIKHGASYEEVMRKCLKLINRADCVCMLHGWTKSLGANREYGYALAKGKYIIDDDIDERFPC